MQYLISPTSPAAKIAVYIDNLTKIFGKEQDPRMYNQLTPLKLSRNTDIVNWFLLTLD